MSLTRSDLHVYQHGMVEWMTSNERCAVWAFLGAGKTATSLTAIADLLDAGIAHRAIVIAPLRVCRTVWAQEAARWAHTQHLRFAHVLGTPAKRIAALDADADVWIVNRENVAWLVAWLKANRRRWSWDLVVIDESSSFKSRASLRWKALKSVLPHIDRMIQLTGTPASNSLEDLWAQIYLLDQGAALGKTITGYRQRYFTPDWSGYTYTLRDDGCADKIHEAVKPLVMALRSSDHLTMTERVDVRIEVELPAAARAAYESFKHDFVVELDGQTIEAASAGVLAGLLLQYAGGAVYEPETKGANRPHTVVHDAKLDALSEIVADNPTEHLLVAYRYRSDLARLRERFPNAVLLDSDASIDAWNAGDVSMALGHPASIGMGLNLMHGGSVLVWFGLTWSLEEYDQTIGRLHRQGQTRTVRVLHLIASGTFDERVMDVLASKDRTQAALLDAVREEIAT